VSNAAFVLIAVAVIIVVSVLLWLLNRKPQTFMSSIDDFEREMKALGGETNKPANGSTASRQRRRAISPSVRRPGASAEGAADPTEPGPDDPTDPRAEGATRPSAEGAGPNGEPLP
jgi:hypothetical protein